MSTLRTLDIDGSVRRADVWTERGTFATFAASPQGTALPHGNVFLVPGFTGSKEDFAVLLPLLAAAGWNAATYDQRGQFDSPAVPDDDFSLAGFAADALMVAGELLGDEEQVHLVGHSFGGLVAAEAALFRPQRWATLTLMCSGPGRIEHERQSLLDAAARVERQGLESAYQASVRRNRDRGLAPPEPEIEKFLHRRFSSNSPESLAAMARLLAEAPDRTSELAELDLRVAVLRGATDDAWPHDVQADLAAALGTTVVVIPDAGHSPNVEQPGLTRDALVRIWLG